MNLPGEVAWQVRSVLSKIAVCRTAKLLGRLYQCSSCLNRYAVYNSCGDRHCPQCSGSRRADWTARSSQLILPGIDYFQVVFTLPDKLSRLVLGNRRELYQLLFRSAWRAIKQELEKQNIDPAALLVLHTWNQELGHHPHIHALVPGSGPSVNRDNDPCWVTARDVTRSWRTQKPSLVDVEVLGRAFRDKFVRGLGWLIRNAKLTLDHEWLQLGDPKVLRRWLKSLKATDWNVFVQGPPHSKSDPHHVIKYLTRYLTGGPISDQRTRGDVNGMVSFTARSKSKGKGRTLRSLEIPGAEFVRRWSLHVLPQGFTRSRGYGGFHGSRRNLYLQTCRELLALQGPTTESSIPQEIATQSEAPKCPRCQVEMSCIAELARPSWRVVLGSSVERVDWSYEKWVAILGRYDLIKFSRHDLPRPDN